MAGWRNPDKPYWGNRLLRELEDRTPIERRRPADDDRAGGRNTLTRFADLDLASVDPGDECDQPYCIGPEAA